MEKRSFLIEKKNIFMLVVTTVGVRHGLGQFYWSQGNLLSAGDFVNGMCVRGRIFDQN